MQGILLTASGGHSFESMWNDMTWPVKINTIFMLVLSVYCLYVIVERLALYQKGKKQTFDFMLRLRKHLEARNVDDAIKESKIFSKSPVATVMGAGLQAFKKGREALENCEQRKLRERQRTG